MRVKVAVDPSCGRLSVILWLGWVSSTLRSPISRRTGPSMRLASHPARMSSAGSSLRPETSAALTSSYGGWSNAEASNARQ